MWMLSAPPGAVQYRLTSEQLVSPRTAGGSTGETEQSELPSPRTWTWISKQVEGNVPINNSLFFSFHPFPHLI